MKINKTNMKKITKISLYLLLWFLLFIVIYGLIAGGSSIRSVNDIDTWGRSLISSPYFLMSISASFGFYFAISVLTGAFILIITYFTKRISR